MATDTSAEENNDLVFHDEIGKKIKIAKSIFRGTKIKNSIYDFVNKS